METLIDPQKGPQKGLMDRDPFLENYPYCNPYSTLMEATKKKRHPFFKKRGPKTGA